MTTEQEDELRALMKQEDELSALSPLKRMIEVRERMDDLRAFDEMTLEQAKEARALSKKEDELRAITNRSAEQEDELKRLERIRGELRDLTGYDSYDVVRKILDNGGRGPRIRMHNPTITENKQRRA